MIVSLITATHNSSKSVESTLKSVASQSYKHIEHIIIDGESTDNTLDIVARFPHVKSVTSEPDEGIYDAINKGIRKAKGSIIGILNSDDYYTADTIIEDIVRHFEAHEQDQAVYADLDYIDDEDHNVIYRQWRSGKFQRSKFLFGWTIPHPTLFLRREVYDQYGLYNTDFRLSGDYEYILRTLFKNNLNAGYLKKVTVKMRKGGSGNGSVKKRKVAHMEDYQAWRTNGISPYFFTITLKPIRKISQYVVPRINRFLAMIF